MCKISLYWEGDLGVCVSACPPKVLEHRSTGSPWAAAAGEGSRLNNDVAAVASAAITDAL